MKETTNKQSHAQLVKRIQRAVVLVDRTKDTKDFYFGDKGLRITINEENAVISTNYHKHVFSRWTASGESKPYIYTQFVLNIVLGNQDDCIVELNGEKQYSYKRLMDVFKDKEDKQTEYLILHYYQMWLFNIFNPLYSISESEKSMFVVYLDYVFNIVKNEQLLSEHTDDVTNKQFIENVCLKMKDITSDITERVVFKKMTDEEFAQKEMEAMQEQENEQILENKLNEKKNESKNKETE